MLKLVTCASCNMTGGHDRVAESTCNYRITPADDPADSNSSNAEQTTQPIRTRSTQTTHLSKFTWNQFDVGCLSEGANSCVVCSAQAQERRVSIENLLWYNNYSPRIDLLKTSTLQPKTRTVNIRVTGRMLKLWVVEYLSVSCWETALR